MWLPEHARIRAQSGGFVEEVLAKDGQTVKRGDPLMVLSDPELIAKEAALRAEVTVLDVEYNRVLAFDAAHAQLIGQDATAKRAELAEAQRRLRRTARGQSRSTAPWSCHVHRIFLAAMSPEARYSRTCSLQTTSA